MEFESVSDELQHIVDESGTVAIVLCVVIFAGLFIAMSYLTINEFYLLPKKERKEEQDAIDKGDYKRAEQLRQRRLNRNRPNEAAFILPRTLNNSDAQHYSRH